MKMTVYGNNCTWYNDKSQAGINPNGLPCCPHCGSMLFEEKTEKWENAILENALRDPEYLDLLLWARGRCFRNFSALKTAFQSRNDPAYPQFGQKLRFA